MGDLPRPVRVERSQRVCPRDSPLLLSIVYMGGSASSSFSRRSFDDPIDRSDSSDGADFTNDLLDRYDAEEGSEYRGEKGGRDGAEAHRCEKDGNKLAAKELTPVNRAWGVVTR
ncbi:hypothetical protein PIB30_024546 [Stylosanthes scabra]|uniref:Uncharacterized protein n=1 Tax=Stylosanthes scabra TaxID=79078 RepID=A0ABU6RAA3_9FABA|nr:hypothetical protein [Stylosanthes scabra]